MSPANGAKTKWTCATLFSAITRLMREIRLFLRRLPRRRKNCGISSSTFLKRKEKRAVCWTRIPKSSLRSLRTRRAISTKTSKKSWACRRISLSSALCSPSAESACRKKRSTCTGIPLIPKSKKFLRNTAKRTTTASMTPIRPKCARRVRRIFSRDFPIPTAAAVSSVTTAEWLCTAWTISFAKRKRINSP